MVDNKLVDKSKLFIMRNTHQARKAFGFWIREQDYDNEVSGWRDRRGNPGVTLEKGGVKVGVIICTEDTEPDVLKELENYGKEKTTNGTTSSTSPAAIDAAQA